MPADPAAVQVPVSAARPRLGIAAAVLAVTVWGSSSVFIKQVEGLDGVVIATYRLWVGAAMVTALFVATGGRITGRLLRLSLWGGLAFAADIALFFAALQRTSVANATVIGALQPLLLLAVAGPLFGEQPRRTDALWGLLAIGGAAVVVAGGDGGGASGSDGDLLAIGALLAWTAYFVASKTARAELSSFEYLTGLSLVAAVCIVPVPFALGVSLEAPSGDAWLLIVVIALVNGAFGHFLMNWAHPHVPLVVTSLLTLGVPVVSSAVAVPVLDEALAVIQVVGMAVVVGSLAVVAVNGARRRPTAVASDVVATATLPEP